MDGRPDRAAHRHPALQRDHQDHITEALEAVRLFSERDDLHLFYPSAQNYRDNAAKQWITHLHQLQVVLFHRGQIATQPRKLMPSWKPPLVLPPKCRWWRTSGWPPGG